MDKNKWFKLWHLLDELTKIEDDIGLIRESILRLQTEFEGVVVNFYVVSTIRSPIETKSYPVVTFVRNALEPDSREELLSNFADLYECYTARKPFIIESETEKKTTFIYPVIAQKDIQYIYKAEFPNFFDHVDPVLRHFFSILFNYYSAVRSNERDFLTGLYNRKAFNRIVNNLEKKKAIGDQQRDYLIVIDIDFFKRINDTWGHMIGDEVLILFARLLLENTRTQDSVFRTGGEEFIILARQMTVRDAQQTCERLRRSVEETIFPQARTITISIGFAPIEQPLDVYLILKKADRALYYAKEHGRNQVCSYDILVAEHKIEPVHLAADMIDIW